METLTNRAIKPIETAYNGFRFRSRLEARWAVFFDCLGIKYEYEPEGFTDGKVRYLPDFYLPEGDCYVEIKPNPQALGSSDMKKLALLARHKRTFLFDQGVGMAGSEPFPSSSPACLADGIVPSYQFSYCLKCGATGIRAKPGGRVSLLDCECSDGDFIDGRYSPQAVAARVVAKQARFEKANLGKGELLYAWLETWTRGLAIAMAGERAEQNFEGFAKQQLEDAEESWEESR